MAYSAAHWLPGWYRAGAGIVQIHSLSGEKLLETDPFRDPETAVSRIPLSRQRRSAGSVRKGAPYGAPWDTRDRSGQNPLSWQRRSPVLEKAALFSVILERPLLNPLEQIDCFLPKAARTDPF